MNRSKSNLRACDVEHLKIVHVQRTTDEYWNRIWSSCPYSTFFHSHDWAEIWAAYSAGRIQPWPLLITFSDERKALLPLSVSKRRLWPIPRFFSSPAGTFGGWISTDVLGPAHQTALVDFMTRNLGNVVWRLNPYDRTLPVLPSDALDYDDTQAVDLRGGFESVRRKWTKGALSAANKARREGVRVRKADCLEDWYEYLSVYEDSIKRWGSTATSTYKWELFQAIFDRKSENVTLWLSEYEGNVVAGALVFYSPNHVVYWHGAALERYFRLRPVNLLMYEAIQDACDRGSIWYDFNPSGGHKGVKSFKKGFGTEDIPAPIVHLQNARSRIASNMFRLVYQWRNV